MNKNILFFAVLGFFSLTTIASEDTLSTEEITNVVESVEANDVAAEIATPATEVAETVEAVVADVATFTPMKFTLSLKVTPDADASKADFDSAAATIKELIEAGHRGSPSLYQSILTFIKELQEAVVAGMNLLTVASTSQESITSVVEEVAVAALTETAENALEQITHQNISAKGIVDDVKNNITIAYSIVVDKVENLALWESVKAQLIALADAFNARTKSPAELSSTLETIMQEAQPLHNSVTTLSASTCDQQ